MAVINIRERKKEATRTRILETSINLINEFGFAETTMQLIADRAEVSLRTLYNYFPSKESMVAQYIKQEVLKEYRAHWPELLRLDSTYDRLWLVCLRLANWSESNRILTEVYAGDPRNYFFAPGEEVPRSGIEEVVSAIIDLGQKKGDIIVSVPKEALVRQFLGFYYMSILTWLGNSNNELQKVLFEGLNLIINGIKTKGVQ